ncbi:MAG: molybdopterin converting factor subunit 1 [Lutibacter sp.]|uniref:molybdopterin converting factor subunit 1 n=1 Tax=Lutibacter sp. TaxID=1925666 RepID=UPI0019E70101|nr:molybdopterin converting factor subunit 1 [Lutibacter sp.]NOR29042.1 molybdopterin converting factor subunit 1 [Lutibacter sp.]
MKIQVLFFGITTDLVGGNSTSFNLTEKTTIEELKAVLILKYSSLKNIHEFAVAVNEEYATNEVILKEGDVVAIIPPVSGG